MNNILRILINRKRYKKELKELVKNGLKIMIGLVLSILLLGVVLSAII